MDSIRSNFTEARDVLDRFISNDDNFQSIVRAGDIMRKAVNQGKKIISCGNGGSMCDAMHFAEELTGKFRSDRRSIPAVSISNPGHLTCVGNDYGFDFVFSRFVEGMGQDGDVLLAISTSGNSKNVIEAAKAAHDKGMSVVGLTGKDGGALADWCDVEIRVEWDAYADRVQEVHIKVIHCLIDYIERGLE